MSDKPIPCRAKKSEHTGDRIYWCTDPDWIAELGGPTHEIWPIERSWFCKELERENRWMAAKIGDKEYDAMREAMKRRKPLR